MNHRVSYKSKAMRVTGLALLVILLLITPVLAGEGDGSGGGQGVPLGLASSIPADGQQGVSIKPEIKLTFNKNVISLEIRDANKNCFSLVSAHGSMVPIEVVMADDQIYPEEKRNISLKPLQQLQPGTAYTVKISPQLQAKNGTSLGHEVTVKFVTQGAAPLSPEPVIPPAALDTAEDQTDDTKTNTGLTESKTTKTMENKIVETDQSEPTVEKKNVTQTKSQPVESPTPTPQAETNSYGLYMLAGGLVLLAASGYIYYKKRKMK